MGMTGLLGGCPSIKAILTLQIHSSRCRHKDYVRLTTCRRNFPYLSARTERYMTPAGVPSHLFFRAMWLVGASPPRPPHAGLVEMTASAGTPSWRAWARLGAWQLGWEPEEEKRGRRGRSIAWSVAPGPPAPKTTACGLSFDPISFQSPASRRSPRLRRAISPASLAVPGNPGLGFWAALAC